MATHSESPDENLEMELLENTARGDRASFLQLYERYSGVLFSIAFRVLNDQAETEEVVQDVFIQIWDKAALYDRKRGKPLTWALTLTRNRSIDRLRVAKRRRRVEDEVEKETSVGDQRGSGPDAAVAQVSTQETNRLVRAAVLELSYEQRQAIELAYFGGLTQNEIAQTLAEPLGTVKARIRRGMIRLKDLIEPRL
jgi:RNA polymerase sigma-70 factor (ECF subfamily)